jgi:hypothetical protein
MLRDQRWRFEGISDKDILARMMVDGAHDRAVREALENQDRIEEEIAEA